MRTVAEWERLTMLRIGKTPEAVLKHAIIPSRFCCILSEPQCCYLCEKKASVVFMDFRVMVTRHAVPITSMVKCLKCSDNNLYSGHTILISFDAAKSIGACLTSISVKNWDKKNITHFNLIQNVVAEANGTEKTFITKTIGRKCYQTCFSCKEKNPKFRCGKCHFVRFCNDQCMAKSWPLHREKCGLICDNVLFFDPVFIQK